MTDATRPPRTIAMLNSDGKSAPVAADPPGVVTTLHDLRFRVLARTPYEHLFTELGSLDAAQQALAGGCDVVYIDTFGDYAIDRIRALTSRPVVGAGEASIRYAGERYDFSIVTVWPRSMRYLYDARLAATPGGERCRGVHHLSEESELDRLGRSDGVKARMGRHESDLVDDLVDLCRAALERDGSAAVLLGCTCMAPVAEAIRERVDAPVLDPSAIGLATAHAAALAAPPAAAAPSWVRHTGLAGEVVDAYLAARDEESVWVDDCEVCAVSPATVRREEEE